VTRALQLHRINTDFRIDSKQVGDLDCYGIQRLTPAYSVTGESPPPPPRIFFGRDDLIEKAVAFAERLTPIALVGAGGIGKTSIALTILHDDRIKRRFGENRRFIRCDKFPASLPHFLRRLSKAIDAGIENPEDLTPLRTFLSSRDMFIVLDNAESVLDPHVTSAEEIYAAVEELSQLGNICLCITSRISTVPPDCKWLEIPTLSKEAACDTFRRIYQHGGSTDPVNNILEQLDFHPLSITLLATVAHHNKWNTDRLAREWGERRTDMLRTDHNKGLAATIGLSLSSLMFQELGPDARDLLGVVAFFPQGVDENNIDWLFPTISGRKYIFDKFCVLSLAYRSDGFITMLAPIRDHLSPKDPASAPLLCLTKERYFSRLSVDVYPNKPGFEEARWITSEDVNVEHLLDVFTTNDATSGGVWGVCDHFMEHLYWHKPRLVMLGRKIEALADDHPSKVGCLLHLSGLFRVVGNYAEPKRLLTHALELSREQGDSCQLAQALRQLSDVHLWMDLYDEGIPQAREASEIYERLGDTVEQARCLTQLAWLLHYDKQFDAAEIAASRAIDLLQEKEDRFQVCHCHHVLGTIYYSKGETTKAIQNLEIALGIASSFSWLHMLSCVHLSLADVFSYEDRFDDAHTHVEHAKLHATNDHDTHLLARAMWRQSVILHRQRRFEEARSEGLHALDAFEKLGAAYDVECVGELLQEIDRDARESDGGGECLRA
jgi:tetratricopeptide (TPR) repeat protein